MKTYTLKTIEDSFQLEIMFAFKYTVKTINVSQIQEQNDFRSIQINSMIIVVNIGLD
jgi:hypothetical protein